jgi:lysozyme family protein
MSALNFDAGLAFVWRKGFDDPADGYHVTPGDTGGGTFGGVIEATWANAVTAGIVQGVLAKATLLQLSTVLRVKFWGTICDTLPDGVDLLVFNGTMMTGHFAKLFQQCCGFIGADDVDGWIGPETLKQARARDPATLIDAVSGVHCGYLETLAGWPKFGGAANGDGWTGRLKAAQTTAHAMIDKGALA